MFISNNPVVSSSETQDNRLKFHGYDYCLLSCWNLLMGWMSWFLNCEYDDNADNEEEVEEEEMVEEE